MLALDISFIYIRKIIAPYPGGTPMKTGINCDKVLLKYTCCVRLRKLVRKKKCNGTPTLFQYYLLYLPKYGDLMMQMLWIDQWRYQLHRTYDIVDIINKLQYTCFL